jgi:hypothetical protein
MEPTMTAREAAMYQALVRLVALIERHEPLRRLAAASQALERLREQIREIERLAEEGEAAGRTSPMLTASKEALRKLLWAHMDTVQQAVECSILDGTLLPNLSPPPLDSDITQLTTKARAVVTLAGTHEDALKRAGLQWSLIGDISTLATALDNVAIGRRMAVTERSVATDLMPVMLRAARVRAGLLHGQLKPAMTPQMLSEWKAAAALGRQHRATPATPQVEAPPEVKALPPAPEVRALPPAPDTSLLAMASKARRAVLRLLRPSESHPAAAQQADVSVTEMRRLPSSTDAKTGTDDGR